MVEGVRPSCWLCERPLGRRVQQHHPVPKAKKGRETVPVHPICHRAIHANFTNAQLARFVEWVADKPPDFHAPTRKPR